MPGVLGSAMRVTSPALRTGRLRISVPPTYLVQVLMQIWPVQARALHHRGTARLVQATSRKRGGDKAADLFATRACPLGTWLSLHKLSHQTPRRDRTNGGENRALSASHPRTAKRDDCAELTTPHEGRITVTRLAGTLHHHRQRVEVNEEQKEQSKSHCTHSRRLYKKQNARTNTGNCMEEAGGQEITQQPPVCSGNDDGVAASPPPGPPRTEPGAVDFFGGPRITRTLFIVSSSSPTVGWRVLCFHSPSTTNLNSWVPAGTGVTTDHMPPPSWYIWTAGIKEEQEECKRRQAHMRRHKSKMVSVSESAHAAPRSTKKTAAKKHMS